MVLSVPDEVRAGGQEMSMQLLPSSEHLLCGRLEEEVAQLAQALTPLVMLSPPSPTLRLIPAPGSH